MRDELKLENIRSNLIRQEETIIFSLIERSQFGRNSIIYKNNGISIPDFDGSFMMFLLTGTEKLHSMVRRYTAPDEHPFSINLSIPIIPEEYEWPIKRTNININSKILDLYINDIIPMICKKDDDANYGSAAVNDIISLQSISKRIHYGKYVAESKYLEDPIGYEKLIKANDIESIMKKLTNKEVEDKILKRVETKTSTYGQELNTLNPIFKIQPEVINTIYKKYIIPLTKEVEVLYLLERLD